MTNRWFRGIFIPNYVTEERFDAAINRLDAKIDAFRDDVTTKLDGIATIVRRIDEDRPFMIEWIHRIESDVNRIKGHLKLA